jgi:hypothetical protein
MGERMKKGIRLASLVGVFLALTISQVACQLTIQTTPPVAAVPTEAHDAHVQDTPEPSGASHEKDQTISPPTSETVWITSPIEGYLYRIEPEENRISAIIYVGRSPADVTTGLGYVWVANKVDGTVAKISPEHNQVITTTQFAEEVLNVEYGYSSIWAATTLGIAYIDAEKGGAKYIFQEPVEDFFVNDQSIWASQKLRNRIIQIEPISGQIKMDIALDGSPTAITYGFGSVWAVLRSSKLVIRIDPATGEIIARIPLDTLAWEIAIGEQDVWVTGSNELIQISPYDNRVLQSIETNYFLGGIAIGESGIWISHPNNARVSKWALSGHEVTGVMDVGKQPSQIAIGDFEKTPNQH